MDTASPCNNEGTHLVGLKQMLASEVLGTHGMLCLTYRDPEETEKEDQAAAEKTGTKEEF